MLLWPLTLDERIYVVGGCGPSPHPMYPEVLVYDFPVISIHNKPYLEAVDSLVAEIHEDCKIYVVPEGTQAIPDSITKYQIASWDADGDSELNMPLQGIPPGLYQVFGIALDGRMGVNTIQFQLVEEKFLSLLSR